MNEVDGQLVIHFQDFGYPLYYPIGLRDHSLYQVITETFCEDDWHRYEVPPTLVDPDEIIVDCGAAEGLFSLTVADRCQKIYIIEPLPAFTESLKLTFAAFENVEIIQVALGAEAGQGYLSESDISSGLRESNGIPVEISTIDSLFFDRGLPVTYIKADLEGHDYEMIKGARKTIQKHTPKIAITTYHRQDHARLIEAFLKEIEPSYEVVVKGIAEIGAPVMLHASASQSSAS